MLPRRGIHQQKRKKGTDLGGLLLSPAPSQTKSYSATMSSAVVSDKSDAILVENR